MLNRLDRKLNSLEVLLLVFLKEGITSPYELMMQAGMSAGLSGPALRRMEKAGLIMSDPGPRRASRFTLTKEGEEQLRAALKTSRNSHWFPEKHSLFESAPRAVLMAWLFAGEEDEHDCVDWATFELQDRSRRKSREAQDLLNKMEQLRERIAARDVPGDRGVLMAASYRWLKASLDAFLLEMQALAMKNIDSLINQLPLEIRKPLEREENS